MARLPPGYRTLRRAELTSRGYSPRSERVLAPSGDVISRRQAENIRAKDFGWRSWSEYQRESGRRNKQSGRNDFRRWAEEAAKEHNTTVKKQMAPDSELSRLYIEAMRDDWKHDIGGPFDELLQYTGLRAPEVNYDVGDTP